MIDRDLRRSLVSKLQRLLGGSADTSPFDDAFLFRLWSTDDRGVKEVATLCQSLFVAPLNGKSDQKFGVESEEMTQLLNRSVTFLNSELENEWPAESVSPGRRCVAGMIVFMLLPIVMAFIVFGLPVSLVALQWFMAMFALVSIAIMFYSLRLVAMKPAPVPLRSKRMEYRGDVEVWPFFRRGDHALISRQSIGKSTDWI